MNKDLLDDIAKDNTVIIVAHNLDLASRNDIPDVPGILVNHWDAKLYMDYDKGSAAKTNPRKPSVNLTVMKLRSYKGPRTIVSWMRD